MTETDFDPEIIAFCCNWCSYAGADLAGVSRLKYPPNVSIIRVMCSGRVEPSYILKALELGADGVLVCGCHPGDCHYISGNLKAEKRINATGELLEDLGLDKRMHLEWVSASEGARFAEVVGGFVDELKEIGPNPLKQNGVIPKKSEFNLEALINETKVYYCVECGKCTSACPVSRLDPTYSPRQTIEKALEGIDNPKIKNEMLIDRELWSCLTCGICGEKCPSDVKYVDFVKRARSEASRLGSIGNCSKAGSLLSLAKIQTNKNIKQNRLNWITDDLKIGKEGDLLYFVGCLPYFDNLFGDTTNSIDIAKSTVKILNAAGIEPVIINDERCCGHDLLWGGDFENFEKLAKLNLENIKGVKRVVFSCPECYRTFKIDYPEYFGDLDFEPIHISELLEELIDEGKLEFNKLNEKVTYHDPCRLGRHLGIYDAPRNVLNAIGAEVIEMENSKSSSICCGVSAWINCDSFSKQMQIKRICEAKDTEADYLVTGCPKCKIHMKCSVSNKVPVDREKVDISIDDLSVIVSRALKSGGN